MSTKPVVANKTIPKVVGWLFIVGGTVGVLMMTMTLLSALMGPTVQKAMGGGMEMFQTMIDNQRKTQEAQLAQELKAATTDEQKDAVEKRIANMKAVKTPDMSKAMEKGIALGQDPMMIRFSWADALTGIPLAVLLLASGIGLVKLRGWGRRLGVWVAALALPRAIIMGSLFLVFIAPMMTKLQTEMVQEMFAGNPAFGGGAAPGMPFSFEKLYTITNTATGLFIILAGSGFSLLWLWLLTKRSVKAACGEIPTGFAPAEPGLPAAPRDPYAPIPGFPTEPRRP